LEAYQRLYEFELVVLRPANVYGFGHFWSGSGGGELLQTLLQKGMAGEAVQVPQGQARDFEYVYCKDIGRAIDLAATVPMPAKTFFNIGMGVITKFEDLLAVAKQLLPKLKVEIKPGKPPHSIKQPMVISQAKHFLSWEPQFNMEAGFRDYLQEIRSNS